MVWGNQSFYKLDVYDVKIIKSVYFNEITQCKIVNFSALINKIYK
jgi:hypothetical protein